MFLLGIAILLVSAEYLVKISSLLWSVLKISPLIVGSTMVAISTIMPELAVAVVAILRGDQGLARGNIIGSNIVNIFLVFATGILLGNINIGISKTQKNGLIMVLATILYIWLNSAFSGKSLGLILIAMAVLFSFSEILMGVEGRRYEDKAFIRNKNSRFKPAMIIKIIGVVIGIVVGGMMVVYSVEKISLFSGYSTTVLGLSLTAISTSLPEWLTVIFSRKKDQKKVATGDVLGSNIYNLLLLGGIIYFFSGSKPVSGSELYFLILSAVCGAVLVFGYAGKKIPRKIGLGLLFLFLVYVLSLRN